MSTQTISSKRAGMPASRAKVPTAPTTRLAFIDNLRVFLVILVTVHHLAVTYGAEGSWYYYESGTDEISSIVLTLFVAVNQAFFMGLFFLIAGYFTVPSLDRKGARLFLKDRLLRLGVPLIFYAFVINPLVSYTLAVNVWNYTGSLTQYLSEGGAFGVGPLWFAQALLLFTFIYMAGRHWLQPATEPTAQRQKLPANGAIALYALAAGVLTFIVRLAFPVGAFSPVLGMQPGHAIQYVSMFAFGILAYRRDWLSQLPEDKVWQRTTIALILLAPVILMLGVSSGGIGAFMGGFNWQALVYALLEQFLAVGLIISLLVRFRKHCNQQNDLLRALAANAYTLYIIHPPVLVLTTLWLRDLHLYPLIKFALTSLLCVPVGFLIAHYLRKLPLIKKIL
jgi:surface polysaccharide O-acyltransferase-like enzyme